MKTLLTLIGVLSICSATFINITPWPQYKQKFGKSYNGFEDIRRQGIYLNTVNQIWFHNFQYDKGFRPFKLGINQFSDMTHQEYLQIFRPSTIPPFGGFYNNVLERPIRQASSTNPSGAIPDTKDWRSSGNILPVENQGTKCSSGWAFASKAALEAYTPKAPGLLGTPLSAQNLIDCVPNANCARGTPEDAYNYIITNQNINTASSYPYEGTRGTCRYNPNNIGATLAAFQRIVGENELKTTVGTMGPVVIAFDPSPSTFKNYAEGIFEDAQCSSLKQSQPHHMLVVGYGRDSKNQFYWVIKNSFDTTWGENGYIRIARNNCGIGQSGIYPIV